MNDYIESFYSIVITLMGRAVYLLVMAGRGWEDLEDFF
jgi:hypothetical protein